MSWLYTYNSSKTTADQRSREAEATLVRTKALDDQRPLPVVFGTVDLDKPPFAWFSLDTTGKVTQLLSLCYGPIDVWLGLHGHAKPIWRGYNGGENQNTAKAINLPNLYGGDNAEGGFKGNIFFAKGSPRQVMWDRVRSLAGDALGMNATPNYNNTAMLLLDEIDHGNAQNIPPYLVRVQRTATLSDGGEQWLPQYSSPTCLIAPRRSFRLCIALAYGAAVNQSLKRHGYRTIIENVSRTFKALFVDLHDLVTRISGDFDIELTWFSWATRASALSAPILVSNRADLIAAQNAIDALMPDATNMGNSYSAALNRVQEWATTATTLTSPHNVCLFLTALGNTDSDPSAFITANADLINRRGTYGGSNAVDIYALAVNHTPDANLLALDNTPEDGVPNVPIFNSAGGEERTSLDGVVVTLTEGENEFANAFKSPFSRSIGSMNPVHIIRECMTDQLWGLGIPETAIGDGWEQAAEQVYNEEICVSTTLHTDVDIIDFIRNMLRYIDGVISYRYGDGYRMKLLRRDYSIRELPNFSTGNCTVQNIDRNQLQNNHNTVDVSFRDIRIETDPQSILSVSVQDLALVERDEGIIRQQADYTALTSQIGALQLAQRDLTAQSQPLLSAQIRAFPSAARNLNIGDAVRLNYATYDIDIIMRVMALAYGSESDAAVAIDLLQDVFDTPLPTGLIQTALYNVEELGRGWGFNWGNEWSGVD